MENTQDRTIPVCFSLDKLLAIKEYAMSRRMISYEQAIEELIENLDDKRLS